MTSTEGAILVSNYDGPVTVYKTDGTTTYTSAVCPASVKVSAGIYIVVLDGVTAKIAVR